MRIQRDGLLADASLSGRAWCAAHARVVDEWLASLLADATSDTSGLALVAVGGYGRSELCPQSDIDVYLVHERADSAEIAERVWYPIWNEALHLGHSVYTVREATKQAADDLQTATALLAARHIAGDEAITAALITETTDLWHKRAKRWLTELGATVATRHEKAGEVAFALEPDLKEGRGGLRDAHALGWAEVAQPTMLEADRLSLAAAYGMLLDARVELQRRTGRATNVLALEDQDEVAGALQLVDADMLMNRVADAARTIAWTSDDTWRRIRAGSRGPLGRLGRRSRTIDADLAIRDGELHVRADANLDLDLVLRATLASAAQDTPIERGSLDLISGAAIDDRAWTDRSRQLFVDLLLTGRAAIGAIEALDQRGVWTRIIPEWAGVRALSQRNPYHRFTVDRHLLEAAATAAGLARSVSRPNVLVMAALLHDIGKGGDEDHTAAGTAIATTILDRMGFGAEDSADVVGLVDHHLLLADVATRRDLDDPTTIERVATSVGSMERLHLLAALTEADSRATGTSAWGPWKAELVAELVVRVEAVLDGHGVELLERFPTTAQLKALDAGEDSIISDGGTVTVMTGDRPGVFSRVAGVLALHGLDVLAAAAYSSDEGRALAAFQVTDPAALDAKAERFTRDLRLALDGRLALGARLADRIRTYRRTAPQPSAADSRVTIDVDASTTATVIDVRTVDGIGVLYRITRALAELDLDIRSARVQTLGASVVDAFYVRDRRGRKTTDADLLREIERAVLHALEA